MAACARTPHHAVRILQAIGFAQTGRSRTAAKLLGDGSRHRAAGPAIHYAYVLKCAPRGVRTKVAADLRPEAVAQ